jgi:hypothetical protein
MLAAQAGDEDITRLLLDVGADANYVQSVSYSPTQKPPVFVNDPRVHTESWTGN